MADWWARHSSGAAHPSAEEALKTTPSNEDTVEDTVAAFRTALRQADGIDSAADLQNDAATETDDAPTDSLDYFAPAFRQVLGADERCMETSGTTAENDTESGSSPVQEEASTESLHYFVPALPSASGHDERGTPLGKAFSEMTESEESNPAETPDPAQSLDYFAPAFRRVLGQPQNSSPEGPGVPTDQDEETQKTTEQRKATPKAVSKRERAHPSALERSGAADLDLDLDRLAEQFFALPSRNLVGAHGH